MRADEDYRVALPTKFTRAGSLRSLLAALRSENWCEAAESVETDSPVLELMTVESLKRGADTPAVGEIAETPNGAGAMTVDGEAQPEMTDTGHGDSVRSFESDCSCCRIVSSLQSALRPRSPSGRNCVDSCAPSELGRRSARHARHARRLCCLRLDYVRRVPRVGEGGVVVHRDPSALLDGVTCVLLALRHPSTRREMERSD